MYKKVNNIKLNILRPILEVKVSEEVAGGTTEVTGANPEITDPSSASTDHPPEGEMY